MKTRRRILLNSLIGSMTSVLRWNILLSSLGVNIQMSRPVALAVRYG